MSTSQTDRLAGVIGMPGFKTPVKAATTGNITLSGEQTIDGVAVVDGDRVLVKDQTTATENGIWECDTGEWVRTKDFNGAHDVVNGCLVYVNAGTLNYRTMWRVNTSDPITIGTSSISWAKAGVATDVDTVETQTATSGQTAFTLSNSYSPGVATLDVYQNGIRLILNSDYTETDTTTVTLTYGAVTGDQLTFATRRMTTPGGTIDAANVSFTDVNNVATNAQVVLPRAIQRLEAWVTSSNQNVSLGTLPANTWLESIMCHVTEAFDSDGTDQITVGWDADTNGAALSVDVSNTGVLYPSLGVRQGYSSTERALEIYYTNGGSEPTTGKALVVAKFFDVTTEPA